MTKERNTKCRKMSIKARVNIVTMLPLDIFPQQMLKETDKNTIAIKK